MPRYTTLTGAGDLTADSVTAQIEQNTVDFFRYAFVEAGGFTEVAVVNPGVTSSYDLSRLFPVQKDGAANGTIWQAQRTDWCYETGLESGYSPTVPSGVYVNGTLYPTSNPSGPYAHYFDFPRGRAIFKAPIPTTSVVQVAYSARLVSVFDQSVPWFKEVVLDTLLTEQANAAKGGVIAVLNDYRVQPPLVVVEATARHDLDPVQIGDNSHWVNQVVLFHILTQDKTTRDNVMNAITLQQDSTIFLYDTNARRAAGDFQLDWRGSPVPGAKGYPQLVDVSGYRFKRLYFTKMTGQSSESTPPLYRAVVRGVLTTDYRAS